MILDLSGCLLRAKAAARSYSTYGSMRRSLTLLAGLTLVPLNGCLGHHYVKTDFKGYETAFAETSNRELLLNLARLENRDPAYFFKMGQITSSYRMQSSLTATGQLTSSSGAVQIPNGGGSPGVIFENDPTFQFIPVNDDTNARLLMAPIQPETFYALYQQGWRLDQLFRLLVDRIEVSQPDGKGGCRVEVFHNAPPVGVPNPGGEPGPAVSTDGKTRYSTVGLSHYVTFLRVSALVYELQKSGILVLRGTNEFVPYDSNSFMPYTSGDEKSSSSPQAKDQNDAVARNDIWERKMSPDGKTQVGWVLGHKVFSAVFYLSPIVSQTDANGVTTYSSNIGDVRDALEKDLQHDPDLSALNTGPALRMMLQVMAGGFSLEGSPNPAQSHQDVCPAETTAHLYMRSIIELMAASAQEEVPFRELMKKANNPLVPPDPQNRDDKSTPQPFRTEVPRIEQMPVLRLQWHDDNTVSPLVTVNYRDKTYSVTDAERPAAGSDEPWVAANATWNRDMFRLIEGLSSQVTVDISKFPLPEILQLHSD
jgi:hypothetical protein